MKRFGIAVLLLALAMTARGTGEMDSEEAGRRLRDVQAAISELEAGLHAVCRQADAGRLRGTVKLTAGKQASWLGTETLTFSAATFDRDLDKALDVLGRYEKTRASLRSEVAPEAGSAPVQRPMTVEERLRAAEEVLPAAGPIDVEAGGSFSVFEAYEGDHKQRQAMRDRMAEEDMANVAEERRLAAAEADLREKAARKIQEQNRKWQEELDAQVLKDVQEAEAWQREHSAGAFFRKLTRNIVGGAVTSFSGGFARGLGTGAADYVIRKKFPDFQPTGKYDRDDD